MTHSNLNQMLPLPVYAYASIANIHSVSIYIREAKQVNLKSSRVLLQIQGYTLGKNINSTTFPGTWHNNSRDCAQKLGTSGHLINITYIASHKMIVVQCSNQ